MSHYLEHWTKVAVDAANAVTLPLRVHTTASVPQSRRSPDRGGHIDNVRPIGGSDFVLSFVTVYDWETEPPDDAA